MAEIPAFLYALAGEDITVEPFTGGGAYGDSYGPPVTVRGIVDEQRKLVRSTTGDQVVSSTQVYCPLATEIPTDSRVTVRGTTTTVITANRRDGRGLPVPSHLEVVLE